MKYFSMFSGIGGFEYGIEKAWRTEYQGEEENISDTKRDKSIFERQQKRIDNKTDFRIVKSSKDTSGTLFQNRQKQSNSKSSSMEESENDIRIGQQIRQGSNGILRERDGVRDDKESLLRNRIITNNREWECVGFSEIDKYAIQTYLKHYPTHKNFGDATKINTGELPDFDMLCGGFPCQSFSIAGKRRGFDDTRGTLFFEIARIIKAKRPKLVFLENVKGLLNHNKGETFSVIIQALEELGYDVQWMVLNSKFFGVPQNRERVFIIGSLRGTTRPEILPIARNDGKIDEGLQKLDTTQTISTRTGSTAKQQTIVAHSLFLRTGNPKQGGTGHLKKQDGTSYCLDGNNCQAIEPIIYPTLSTELAHSTGRDFLRNGGHKIKEASNQLRRLTPTECERLQGFPDNWTEGVSDTQRYKQLGNAVTTNVIEAIARELFS